MSELIEFVTSVSQQVIGYLGYPGIALLMFVETLFPPIPSELVLPFGGFLASTGRLSLSGVAAAGTIGSVAGALTIYLLGRRLGDSSARTAVQRYGHLLRLSEDDLARAFDFFDRHGDAAVLGGRVLPLLRSLISLPAGMRRMPAGRFLILTILGSGLWSMALASAGFLLGRSWKVVWTIAKEYEWFVTVVAIVGVILFLLIRIARKRLVTNRSAHRS